VSAPDPIAFARPASTVIVARDGASGLEILLTQRHARMRFMAGAFVFPGGAVASSDEGEQVARQIASAAPAWPSTEDARLERAFAIAAVRETFEEVGLLLGAPPRLQTAQLAAMRARLTIGEDFGALLASEQIAIELHGLLPLIRWITPRSEPIRFDTRFYIARAPRDQVAQEDGRECIALAWRTATDAIRDDAGTILMSPPTRRTLQELQSIGSVDALLEHARGIEAPTVEPVLKLIDGARTIVYPGDPEHPVSERALLGPTRRRL
jgi:8-oxo-dGTP pyrophosphatase MutT (NUDIX family)